MGGDMETTATIDCLRLNPFGGTLSATSPNLKAFFRTQGWSCDSRYIVQMQVQNAFCTSALDLREV